MREEIEQIHRAYCLATGQDIKLAYDREHVWYQFLQAGFTISDVQLVGNFLRRAVEKGDRNPGCLRFRNMIEPINLFEEELQLCKAAMRNFKPPRTEKDKTIQAFRPSDAAPIHTPSTAMPAKEVVEAAMAKLRGAVQ